MQGKGLIALGTLLVAAAGAKDAAATPARTGFNPVSYTHLTLPTNREV